MGGNVDSNKSNNNVTSYTTPPHTCAAATAILDTGTTGHFLLDTTPCANKQTTQQPVQVQLPNGQTIASTHTAQLNIPNLPETATTAHIFPGLENNSLLSVGILCDHGCTATFDATGVTVNKEGTQVLQGQ